MRGLHWVLMPLAFLGLSVPGTILAGDFIKPGEEKFKLSAGAFLQNFDTNVRVKPGGHIDLENDLGYDNDDFTGWINGYWRIASRHRIGLGYFQNKRDVEAVARTDIPIGDGETIPAGAGFSSDFKVQVVPAYYAYSFMKRDKFELAGTIGLHWYSVNYEVGGAAGIGDAWVGAGFDVSADAPMPLIGLRLDYYVTDRWYLNAGAAAFAMEVDTGDFNFQGWILDTRVATEYWFLNNLGAGAGLSWFKLNVDVDDSDWEGNLEYDYWGPQVYVTTRF